MSAATSPTPAFPSGPPPVFTLAAEPPVWPISVALYEQMAAKGILGERDRVYLWQGRLAAKMTINRPHVVGVRSTFLALHDLRLANYEAEQEAPMAFRFQASVPEPDVKIVRGRVKDYRDRTPTTADVPLVVEVSEATLAEDRRLAFDYAAEGTPVYWLLNIPGRRVEVYSDPAEGGYTRCTPYAESEVVLVVLDGREVGRLRVADLLP